MDLELNRIFVRVVQQQSFSKAAALLRLPKSTVSKAISKLEKETGTKLMLRTTRSLTLTAAGQAFYESSLDAVQTLEAAQKALYGQDQEISGLVRLTAPDDLGTYFISAAIGALLKRHPRLSFELNYTDEMIDLVRDGYDLAIRVGKLNTSSFKAKKLGEIRLVLVASPKYLEKVPKIRSPLDIKNLDCVSLNAMQRWNLRSKKGSVDLDIHAKVYSNQMTSVMRLAAAGSGVALVPQYLCHEGFARDELVRVLPDWYSSSIPLWLVSPTASASSARLRVTMEYLSESMQKIFA